MHHVTIAAISALCLTQISAAPAPAPRLTDTITSGSASYLHPSLAGNPSYCGGRAYPYNPHDPTYAASPASGWPCGTQLALYAAGDPVTPAAIVTVRDRCPACHPTRLDLSEAAFTAVCGPLSRGVCPITIERYEE